MKKLRKIFSFLSIFISLILIFTFLYSEDEKSRAKSTARKAQWATSLYWEGASHLFGGDIVSLREEFLVKEVVDGDTIKLTNGEIVRYLGIDTPELRWRKGDSWVYHPQLFAEEAKELNSLLLQGKKVKLEYDVEKKDIFNRLLAYVYVDGLMVNSEIIRQGYALLDIRVPNVKHSKELAEAYQQAKKERIGFWKEATEEIISPALVKNFSGKIKTIEGKITRILDKKKIIKLILDGEEKSEFGIVIYKNNLSLFRKEGVNPGKDYLNRKVRLSGLIREPRPCAQERGEYKQNFEIIVHHPAEIEIIE